jgi:hypothetical protein
MKLIVSLSILVLFASCGKYEKPFITFKSPEERLTGTEWECIKAVDADGVEFEVNDRVQFSIDGMDSTFTRIGKNPQLLGASPQLNLNGDIVADTIFGSWTWAYALEGNFNKQTIIQNNPSKNLRVISLSKKVLVLQDKSVDNTTYHYVPL